MEKLYVFKLYTKSDDALVFESENMQEYKLIDYIDRYNNYFLKDMLYYKICEIGTITKI